MSPLQATTVILSYPTAAPPGLKLVANRYVPSSPAQAGYTLLFTHCTGAYKEIWEPIIEYLFKRKDTVSLIREAWSIDWQSHGEAAVFNETLLKSGLSVTEYAIGIKALLASEHLNGHQVIGIGHSVGVTAILLSIPNPAIEQIAYKSMILVESPLSTRADFEQHREERVATLETIRKAIDARRDIWNDRDEALQHFRKRLPYKAWDPRILSLFAKHGLRDVSMEDACRVVNKVTLKCTKMQEIMGFVDYEAHFTAVKRLSMLDECFPIHCVFGEKPDFIPRRATESILEIRKMTSIQFVKRAGHLAVQENPDEVAKCIAQALCGTASSTAKL